MENTFTDNLVLKIVEYDKTGNLDTNLYILYDSKQESYIIRGKRNDRLIDACTYSFQCFYTKELVKFIQFLICKHNRVSYVLYNYDNLPAHSDEITYEFLNTYDDKTYEISGYDNCKIKTKDLTRNLRMLKNVFNYY